MLELHKVIHILTNKIQNKCSENLLIFLSGNSIIISRDFEQVFLQSGGTYMSKDEYKQHIIEAVNKIDDIEFLNRILNYVMKYLAKSGK